MKYIEPSTIEDVISALSEEENPQCVAGGASLVAMMNADLVMADCLIGLRNVNELKGIIEIESGLHIGAMTTHDAIAKEDRLKNGMFVVRDAARQIAHPAVRNMGTIGGSVCHADPNADFPTALTAAKATMEVIGPAGQRSIPASEFFVDYFETSKKADEILKGFIIPTGPDAATGLHLKYSRTDGDFATVSISLVMAVENDICSYISLAVGSVGPVPLQIDEVNTQLVGTPLNEDNLNQAAAVLVDASDPIDDMRGSADYRRALIPNLLKQAVKIGKNKLQG